MRLVPESHPSAERGVNSAWHLSSWRRYGQTWGMVYQKMKHKSTGITGPDSHAVHGGPGEPTVSWAEGVIYLRDRQLIDLDDAGDCRDFLERVFRLAEVRAVEVDWTEGTASVYYDPTRLDAIQALERLAAAARGEPVAGRSPKSSPGHRGSMSAVV